MESELAGHLGLAAKFFCRVCLVKGFDGTKQVSDTLLDNQANLAGDDQLSDTSSIHIGSENGEEESATMSGRHRIETMEQLVARANRFVVVSLIL